MTRWRRPRLRVISTTLSRLDYAMGLRRLAIDVNLAALDGALRFPSGS
jgi:hypothetical protein